MIASDKFLDECKMNYTVTKEPSFQRTFNDKGEAQFSEVENQFNLVRSSDSRVISKKTVSSTYVPMNPRDMVSPIAPLIAEGWVVPDTGYMLSGGNHEVLSFKIENGKLGNEGKILGEDWYHFFQLHNFQGAGSYFGNLFSKRLVCLNGSTRVTQKAGGFRLRHMGALQTKYEDAMRTWKEIQEEIRKFADRMTVWNDTTVTAKEAVDIFHQIFEIENPADISTRTQNELENAIREFSNPQRGTYGRSLYDVYNAITATNTHYRPRSSKEAEAKRISSLLHPAGSRNKLESMAVEVLSSRIR